MNLEEAQVVKEVVASEIESKFTELKNDLTETIKKEVAASAVPAAMKQHKIEVAPPKNIIGTMAKALGTIVLNKKNPFIKTDEKMDTLDDAFAFIGKEINSYVPQMMRKTLNASILAEGGALVIPMYSQEIIQALVAETVMRKAGCPVIDMPNGNLFLPAVDSLATAYWVGENSAPTDSAPSFSQLVMNAKKLAAEVPISNDLIRYGMGNTETMIQADIATALAIAEDAALLEGTGTSYSPKGVKTWQLAANAVATTGTSLAQIKADLYKCVARQHAANVKDLKKAWFMHPSVKSFLAGQETTTGLGTTWANELSQKGTLLGYPVYTTTQISGTSGSAPVYLVDLGYCLIGTGLNLEIRFTPYGSFTDSTGHTISGSSKDMSVYNALLEVDFVVKKSAAVSSITGTAWV